MFSLQNKITKIQKVKKKVCKNGFFMGDSETTKQLENTEKKLQNPSL